MVSSDAFGMYYMFIYTPLVIIYIEQSAFADLMKILHKSISKGFIFFFQETLSQIISRYGGLKISDNF